MAHYCSAQERAISDVKVKLSRATVSENDIDYIISALQREGFLDETRYAKAFVHDKFQLNGWGRIKIRHLLRMKQVDAEAIEEALHQIDEESYQSLVLALASKKLRESKFTTLQDRNNKIARFLLQRGFEPDLVWKAVQSLP